MSRRRSSAQAPRKLRASSAQGQETPPPPAAPRRGSMAFLWHFYQAGQGSVQLIPMAPTFWNLGFKAFWFGDHLNFSMILQSKSTPRVCFMVAWLGRAVFVSLRATHAFQLDAGVSWQAIPTPASDAVGDVTIKGEQVSDIQLAKKDWWQSRCVCLLVRDFQPNFKPVAGFASAR